jgi:3-phosphoshikimate 1-carboxyvinyltransferase
LRGTIAVPGDKSMSHRCVLFGLIAGGPCRATGWLDSEDTRASLDAVRALGAGVAQKGDQVTVTPPADAPHEDVTIDCGNSGTTARLLLGILAGWLDPEGGAVTLTGDASLSTRPMNRVVKPLWTMGADITFVGEEGRLPIRVSGARLTGGHHDLEVPSAQVKSALLLAGLFAKGRTTIGGAGSSRDHTELMLGQMGVSCEPKPDETGVGVDGPARPGGLDMRVPGDPSSAAFFQVAAALVPGSRVTATGMSLNHTRTGALRTLKKAGVSVAIERPFGDPRGETAGDVVVSHKALQNFTLEAKDIPSQVDEIPVLAVLATQAEGTTVISGAEDLRVKESDRLALMAANLKKLGADVEEKPDGLVITGPTPLQGGSEEAPVEFETGGDHRIAMAMAIASLINEGHSVLDNEACVAVSYPNFFETLAGLLETS